MKLPTHMTLVQTYTITCLLILYDCSAAVCSVKNSFSMTLTCNGIITSFFIRLNLAMPMKSLISSAQPLPCRRQAAIFSKLLIKCKGQIKPKADWRAIDSPKKRTYEFVLFAFLLPTANKTNSFVRPKLLSVLSDL